MGSVNRSLEEEDAAVERHNRYNEGLIFDVEYPKSGLLGRRAESIMVAGNLNVNMPEQHRPAPVQPPPAVATPAPPVPTAAPVVRSALSKAMPYIAAATIGVGGYALGNMLNPDPPAVEAPEMIETIGTIKKDV